MSWRDGYGRLLVRRGREGREGSHLSVLWYFVVVVGDLWTTGEKNIRKVLTYQFHQSVVGYGAGLDRLNKLAFTVSFLVGSIRLNWNKRKRVCCSGM